MIEPLIRAHNLSLQSGNKFLLHEINWEVYPGEHWLVFGMNGSGKTTLLSIVAGFNSASSGELTLFGERFTDENIFQMRRKIGWISNSFFEKHLSYESVLNIILSGLSGTLGIRFYVLDEDVYRAKEILKELRIIDKLEIIDIAKRINTYNTSILPYEDCCTIFVPKHPVINPKIEKCEYYESLIDYKTMIDECIKNTFVVKINESKKNNDLL